MGAFNFQETLQNCRQIYKIFPFKIFHDEYE